MSYVKISKRWDLITRVLKERIRGSFELEVQWMKCSTIIFASNVPQACLAMYMY